MVIKMIKANKPLIISLVCNLILSILKIGFGLITNFSALIADGIHSFSDLSTDVIGIMGNKLSKKPADKEHPFGHGKYEYVTSLIIGVLIILLGFKIGYDVISKKIFVPNIFVSVIIIVSVTVKYLLGNYLYKKGIDYKNNILIASGKESTADAYSSLFVLISLVLMQFSDNISAFKYADIIGTLIIALFIIKTGIYIIKTNTSVLLEEQIIDDKYLKKIKNIIKSFDEVIEITDLYILRYGYYYKLISNVSMDDDISLKEAHRIVDEIEQELYKIDDKIKHIFIHMEPINKEI